MVDVGACISTKSGISSIDMNSAAVVIGTASWRQNSNLNNFY
jgi:hypothetical protein